MSYIEKKQMDSKEKEELLSVYNKFVSQLNGKNSSAEIRDDVNSQMDELNK